MGTSQAAELAKPMSLDEVTVLALDAAVEIERMMSGESADQNVIKTFVSMLQESAGVIGANAGVNFLYDPTAADIYGRAIRNASGRQVETLDQLGNEVRQYIQVISTPAKVGLQENLEVLKQFCLSLHEVLISETSPSDDETIMGDAFSYGRAAIH